MELMEYFLLQMASEPDFDYTPELQRQAHENHIRSAVYDISSVVDRASRGAHRDPPAGGHSSGGGDGRTFIASWMCPERWRYWRPRKSVFWIRSCSMPIGCIMRSSKRAMFPLPWSARKRHWISPTRSIICSRALRTWRAFDPGTYQGVPEAGREIRGAGSAGATVAPSAPGRSGGVCKAGHQNQPGQLRQHPDYAQQESDEKAVGRAGNSHAPRRDFRVQGGSHGVVPAPDSPAPAW